MSTYMNVTESLISPENERDWRITANTCRTTYKENNLEILIIL